MIKLCSKTLQQQKGRGMASASRKATVEPELDLLKELISNEGQIVVLSSLD